MTPAQIEEARRWTRLKGWRWMPGMAGMLEADGYRVLAVTDSGEVLMDGWGYTAATIPDVTDPATRGCLLALAREITGSHVHVVFADEDLYRCICRMRGDDGRWTAYSSSGPTETAALLVACERHEVTP